MVKSRLPALLGLCLLIVTALACDITIPQDIATPPPGTPVALATRAVPTTDCNRHQHADAHTHAHANTASGRSPGARRPRPVQRRL